MGSSATEGNTERIDDRDALSDWLADASNDGKIVRTRLRSSERVIARVTDGIYRAPASALREVISNAWDADATKVTIHTDAPRFERLFVRDNGIGMSYDTLSWLLHSIGGSAKRTRQGQRMGIADPVNADRSPSGRLLIGKIGIGLFSVSQLSQHFRIITKVKGNDFRLEAHVLLNTFSEDQNDLDDSEVEEFVSGEVAIHRIGTDDLEAHGTDIILDDIKPRVREILRSADRWTAIAEREAALERGDRESAAAIRDMAPRYHGGWIRNVHQGEEGPDLLDIEPKLPWGVDTPVDARMGALVEAVEGEFSRTNRPNLADTLDTYLHTLWTLALSAPVSYVDKHPFDLTSEDNVRLFWLSNEQRGQAIELDLTKNITIRQACMEQAPGAPTLQDGLPELGDSFQVEFDGVELKHPVRYSFHPTGVRGLETSLMFVGKYSPDLASTIDPMASGGRLDLEGYLFWNGRVVPKENNGVLIRVRGSSGESFRSDFFDYQISEQTRLRQITSELFVLKGLDAALNIDRESFNYSHPHFQLVNLWLHRALRQLTNRHKGITHTAREKRKSTAAAAQQDLVNTHAEEVWNSRRGDDAPPDVTIASTKDEAQTAREQGGTAIVQPSRAGISGATATQKVQTAASALLTVLDAYGLLGDLDYDDQQRLVEDILKIFEDDL